jgi:hypothetical protein
MRSHFHHLAILRHGRKHLKRVRDGRLPSLTPYLWYRSVYLAVRGGVPLSMDHAHPISTGADLRHVGALTMRVWCHMGPPGLTTSFHLHTAHPSTTLTGAARIFPAQLCCYYRLFFLASAWTTGRWHGRVTVGAARKTRRRRNMDGTAAGDGLKAGRARDGWRCGAGGRGLLLALFSADVFARVACCATMGKAWRAFFACYGFPARVSRLLFPRATCGRTTGWGRVCCVGPVKRLLQLL